MFDFDDVVTKILIIAALIVAFLGIVILVYIIGGKMFHWWLI